MTDLSYPNTSRRISWIVALPLFLAGALLHVGCGGDQGTGGDATTTDSATISFEGTVAGKVSASRSTRESLDAEGGNDTGQTLPPDFDPALVRVTFEDLAGEPLLDANDKPYPAATVDDIGAFSFEGLPVGIDFVVVVDLGDGVVIRQIVQIPADESGVAGSIDDVVVDPLTTLIVAKLRALLEEKGIDPDELGTSASAVVRQIVDAFVHLFEESGIDDDITVDDISDLTAGNIEDLFESLVPDSARLGLDTLEGSLALERASEIEEIVRGAAEVFLRAGFPIADGPGGVDLSFLADLPNVEVGSPGLLFPPDEQFIDISQFDETDGGPFDRFGEDQPILYISTVSEPDRNFIVNEDQNPEGDGHHLPMIHEGFLFRVAKLHLEGRIVTLENLHRLLTDAEVGLGVRLTYMLPGPDHQGPPPMIFESADGGVERDVYAFMMELFQSGSLDGSFEDLSAQAERIRAALREFLEGTLPPSFERLFGAILSERIESADQLFSFIREARAHLPFNRSGPSAFYVVADGDPFRPDAGEVNAVSVDVEFGPDGLPARVTYNAAQTGAFYLAFTHETESDNRVELLVRETGRFLHNPHGGPVFLNMGDATLFEPINGVAFADFVSEEGTFWPGIAVAVADPGFRIGEDGGSDGPTMQLFVLADRPGPEGEPVRVNYDIATGTFSASPQGRYYLMFMPESFEQGLFGLYDIELNFMAGVNDLTADYFIEGPTLVPDDRMPPPDDGTSTPDDGTTTPDDGTTTPDDGTATPDDPIDEPPPQEEPNTGDEPPVVGEDPVVPPDDGTSTIDEQPPSGPEPRPIFEPALVAPEQVVGLAVRAEFFRYVYGTDVPNERYRADENPYFDDVNGNGVEDEDEFTADYRPTLFNRDDWRSTDISRYYRRAGGGPVTVTEIDFESSEPRTLDGEALVPRNFLPRLNAFKFGRPNTAINLLTTSLPSEFFNGTHSLEQDTPLGIFQALAMINLVMEQVFNVETEIDIDGDGPLGAQRMVIDARLFVAPIGDPMVLILDGFEDLSELTDQTQLSGE